MSLLHNQFEIIPFDQKYAKDMAECESITLGEEAWTAEGITDTVNSNGAYLVVTENGEYRGHGGFTRVLDEYYITNICVLPSYRRRGIASLILKTMIDFGREQNGAFITLEVRESNLSAIKLYEKFGFSEKGRRKNFYSDPKEDAIIMTLKFR